MRSRIVSRFAAALVCTLGAVTTAQAVTVLVTIENLSPVNGTALTPFWTGFHDGSFDIYDSGVAASPFLEALAEDGNTGPITAAFTGGAQATIVGPGGPYLPGDIQTFTFDLDPNDPNNRYFSYAAMVLPSNDAFVANGDPMAHQLFDAVGNATPIDFFIAGSAVLDAGTEVNDELPANTAFFGQAAPNTGVDENGVVGLHPGFLPAGSGGILDAADFINADFTRLNYPVAQVRITVIPLPGAALLFGSGLLTLLGLGGRRLGAAT